MNKDLRRIACINVKNYVSQRQKDVRFLALSTDKPRDDRDLVRQWCNGPLPPGFPRLTAVRCERMDCNLPVDIIHLSEDGIWDYIYSHDWSTSSSLRICEGHLLRRILECLKDLVEEGFITTHKSTRFDTCCFSRNPTAIKFLNLYEKDMISEDVKISFCNYAINSKISTSILNLRAAKDQSKSARKTFSAKADIKEKVTKIPRNDENQTAEKPTSERAESATDSVASGPKSVPTDFKVIDGVQISNSQEDIHIPPANEEQCSELCGNEKTEQNAENVTDQVDKVADTTKQESNSSEDSTGLPQKTEASKETVEESPDVCNEDEQLSNNIDKANATQADLKSHVSKVKSIEQEKLNKEQNTYETIGDQTRDRSKHSAIDAAAKEDDWSSLNSSQSGKHSSKDSCKLDSSNGSTRESRHSVQITVSKTSDMDADSKVTKSETTMVSRLKQRRRTHRKADDAGKKATMGPGKRLEFDQFGRPKFKPSYETVVDVADFKFNRCSSDSDDEDSDVDRQHGYVRTQTPKPKSKKLIRKKKNTTKEKVREPRLWNTIDPEEHYGHSESEDDEPHWLNGVPPAPVRADVRSLNNYFKTRRMLKYGPMEKKIIFREDSDYFPPRLQSRTSLKQTSLGSTQGMSYFNSQHRDQSGGFPSSSSDLSLPPIPPSSIPSTTELDLNKMSHEAVCGSHGKLCFINALFASDYGEEDGSVVSSSPDEGLGRGTMKYMNIALLHRLKPTYSNDRIEQLCFEKTGEEYATKRRYARDAPKRRIDKIVQKATSMYNEKTKQAILNGSYKTEVEQARAQLPSIVRVPPTPNEQKIRPRAKPDPNRPEDALYKTVKPGETIPAEQYHIKQSPSQDPNEATVPRYFKQEEHTDFRPYLLQALQEFVIIKETVTRPAGRGTIISLTITKPRRYKYGTTKQVCEEHGLYYDHVPNPPYPTPKGSEEPLSSLVGTKPDLTSSSLDNPSTQAQRSTTTTLARELSENGTCNHTRERSQSVSANTIRT